MLLKPQDSNPIHVSHLMHLISAYQITRETCNQLQLDLINAMDTAESTKQAVIVSQDSIDFLFIVYPTRLIGLYAKLQMFEAQYYDNK